MRAKGEVEVRRREVYFTQEVKNGCALGNCPGTAA